MPPTITEQDWQRAKGHFDLVRGVYQELEGMAGVNTSLALRFVFDALAVRFNRGERTESLFNEMLQLE